MMAAVQKPVRMMVLAAAIAVLLLSFQYTAPIQALGGNLAQNPSFENGRNGLPAGWQQGNTAPLPLASWPGRGSRTGQDSVQFPGTFFARDQFGGCSGSDAQLISTRFIPVDTSRDYVFELWSKMTFSSSGATVVGSPRVIKYDANGNPVQVTRGGEQDYTRMWTDSRGWTRIALYLGPSAGFNGAWEPETRQIKLWIGLQLGPEGCPSANTDVRVSIDDVYFGFGKMPSAEFGEPQTGWRASIVDGCNYGGTRCLVGGSRHTGIDTEGSAMVVAAAQGIVRTITRNGQRDRGLGNSIIIEHRLTNGTTVFTLYGHLASIQPQLREGMCIRGGAILGEMGGTGRGERNQYGTHLHFEVKTRATLGDPVTPDRYFGYIPSSASPNPRPDTWGFRDPENYVERVQTQPIVPCAAQ